MKNLQKFIRDIPDFPKKGILFKDITPVLKNHEALKAAINGMADPFRDKNIDLVVGMESRGFLFGPGVALELGIGFAPVRKKGKLPYKTESVSFELEYGHDILEMHTDAVNKGERVLIVDDLLATGGTAAATAELIARIGGEVAAYSFLVELEFLDGRKKLGDYPVYSEIKY